MPSDGPMLFIVPIRSRGEGELGEFGISNF